MTDDLLIKSEIVEALHEVNPPVVLLLNNRNETVGAIYPNTVASANFDKKILSLTNNTERFYLYVDGIGIYFSSFQKVYR